MPINCPLVLRTIKGSKLTFNELDGNFLNLRSCLYQLESQITTQDNFVTGGTYNSTTASLDFDGTVGFTPFSVDVSSLDSDNNVFVNSGNANVATQQLTFTNTTGGTFNVTNAAALYSDNDINVTGGTYNPTNGCVTFSTNSGSTFDICGFVTGLTDTFITGATLVGTVLELERNNGLSDVTVDLSPLSGISENNFVTGGTFNSGSGTLSLFNNNGDTFNVTGFTSGGGSGGVITTKNILHGLITNFASGSNPEFVDWSGTLSPSGTHNSSLPIPFDLTIKRIMLKYLDTTSASVDATFNYEVSIGRLSSNTDSSEDVNYVDYVGGSNVVTLTNANINGTHFYSDTGGLSIDVSAGDVLVVKGDKTAGNNTGGSNEEVMVSIEYEKTYTGTGGGADTFVTGATLNGTDLEIDRNHGEPQIIVDLSPLSASTVYWVKENDGLISDFANEGAFLSSSPGSVIMGGTLNSNFIDDSNNSVILGSVGSNEIISGSSSTIMSSFGSEIINESYAVIVGGTMNSVSRTNPGANSTSEVILGSSNSEIINTNGAAIIGLGGGLIDESFTSSLIGGFQNVIDSSSSSVIVGGVMNKLDGISRSVILGGNNITGTTNDTVYVPNLNIGTIGSGTPLINLGLDTNGFVVTGTTGSSSGGTDTFVTGATLNGTDLEIDRNNGQSQITVDLSSLASDNNVFVNSGNADFATQQLTFTNTTGGTFNVTNAAALYSDNDINVTGGTYDLTTGCVTFGTNSGTTFDVCGFISGFTDTFTTGGTYDNTTGEITFTKSDSSTYEVDLGVVSNVTGFTYLNNNFTISQNSGLPDLVSNISVMTGLTVNGQTTMSGDNQNLLSIIGSGGTEPLLTVEGSNGELFSISDNLTGSLFSVSDISGLPILEVYDDDTVHIGNYQAPCLNTTVKTSYSSGPAVKTIYSVPISAYTGAFFDYTVSHPLGVRAGTIMSIWSGSTVEYRENVTNDIGSTTPLTLSVTSDGSEASLIGTLTGTTAGWVVKTIVRSI